MFVSQAESRGSYQKSILISIILASSFVLAYFPVWKGLLLSWYENENYSHGFLIVPISIYLIWRNRQQLAETQIDPAWWGLPLVVFSLLLYVLSSYAEIKTVSSVSMILTLMSSVVFLYGYRIFRQLLFPMGFLILMVPIPSQIYSSLTIPLQLFVSKTAVWLVDGLGIPVFREGNVINIPGRTLQMVEACSGLRSMMALLTLSTLYGYLTLKSNYSRFFLMLSGVPAAVFVNVIRIVLIVMAFHYFAFDLTEGTAHTVLGLVVFCLALLFIVVTKGVLSTCTRRTS